MRLEKLIAHVVKCDCCAQLWTVQPLRLIEDVSRQGKFARASRDSQGMPDELLRPTIGTLANEPRSTIPRFESIVSTPLAEVTLA